MRFVRLKQPLDRLLDGTQKRGKRAEDMIGDILNVDADVAEDLRWDIRLVPQRDLTARQERADEDDDTEGDTDEPG